MTGRKYGFLAKLDFDKLPVEQVVAGLAQIGYQAVSWPLARFDPRSTTAAGRQHVWQATRQAGLAVSEWVVQQDYVHPDKSIRQARISLTQNVLRAVAALEAGAPVNLFTGPAPWDRAAPRLGKDLTEGEAWDMVRAAFDQLVPLAETLGVPLALEGVFGHLAHDYYTTLELLRHYDSPYLGLNFDPSHGLLCGNDIPWCIRQWGKRIHHVHLKDAVGRPGLPGESFIFPLLGEGEVPWPEMFQALDEIGYSGYLTVEFESFTYYRQILRNDPLAAARLSLDQLRLLEAGQRS
ncbi:MAG: sugar phosphate isomerase/epimerase [Chloroflexi bacterium]|nr:sugar phosphate isomerase/epimerase [Chloroflexota bacterium]